MIKTFLKERRSWIGLFIAIQLLILFISYLDPSISFRSFLYIVFLSCLIFLVFLIMRYNKEIAFYKSMEEWHPSLGLDSLKDPGTPFENIIAKAIGQQAEFYINETREQVMNLEGEQDELLAWIHEVKTPLTTMQLMLERVQDENLKAQLQFEWLRVHLLLDQQLHHRRIPSLENDLYIEKLALDSLVSAEIKSLQSWCFQKGIGFDITLEANVVLSDAKWLGFILRQIITNAVKYSEGSDIIIHSSKQHGTVKLTIQDFGRGISTKDLPRIFDKGFTSTMNHKDHNATGMGLYLTKKAATPLKIHIDVTSEQGMGTVFELTFPKKNAFLDLTGM
ncbi:sensor histidine kinase [Oceanobacillus piezotolerans]|uniref:histidine kinase n=1 Tax=Oceanobacillus piezotolerans TaxID=2448030 RepID=A0A498D468_9BACI|nr:sensor histidine kinase [Oceanobacillus piezotolerans]RLL43665.1 sensor histidine kinase [Oceanobacillus piezotolerans]